MYCHPPCRVHAKSSRWKKHFSGLRLPPVAIKSRPQFSMAHWRAIWTSCTDSFVSILRCSRSVSSTYNIADRLRQTWDVGARKCAPCPFAPCARNIVMPITYHPAGDAPLPCPKPCVLISMEDQAKVFKSPYAVCRKNFISCIASSIDETAMLSTPKD